MSFQEESSDRQKSPNLWFLPEGLSRGTEFTDLPWPIFHTSTKGLEVLEPQGGGGGGVWDFLGVPVLFFFFFAVSFFFFPNKKEKSCTV